MRLRLLEEADLPLTLEWRNQDHIRRWLFNSELISLEEHNRWFKQYVNRDNDFVFIIEETKDSLEAVGQVALYNINWAAREGEFGRLMIGDRRALGHGIAKEATGLTLDLAFRDLDLLQLYLEVYVNNLAARAIYEGYGFKAVSTCGNIAAYTRDREIDDSVGEQAF